MTNANIRGAPLRRDGGLAGCVGCEGGDGLGMWEMSLETDPLAGHMNIRDFFV